MFEARLSKSLVSAIEPDAFNQAAANGLPWNHLEARDKSGTSEILIRSLECVQFGRAAFDCRSVSA